MVDGTSAPDAGPPALPADRAYGTIVVCGGGCYGGYYVRQLARARAAGAIVVDRLLVVDRDPACRVARLAAAIGAGDAAAIAEHGWRLNRRADDAGVPDADPAYTDLPLSFVIADWQVFLTACFAAAIDHADAVGARDAIVPSPLMPNLLANWVEARVAVHRPGALITRAPLTATPATPWQRTGDDGSHYASFATWMCPINCIEPARCPETRGPRDWSMPVAVQAAIRRADGSGAGYDGLALFHTTHRAYGVGMFDVRDAVRADAAIAAAGHRSALRLLVASVSHCHGAMAEVVATG